MLIFGKMGYRARVEVMREVRAGNECVGAEADEDELELDDEDRSSSSESDSWELR